MNGVRRSRPHGPAIEDPTGQWSADRVESEAQRWAASLSKLGLGPREPVGVVAHADLPSLLAWRALRGAGVAVVPFHERLAPAERDAQARHAGARLLLDSHANGPGASGAYSTAPLPKPGEPLAVPHLLAPAATVAADYLVYTSGTEGRPKGVLLAEDGLRRHAHLCRERLDTGPGDRWLLSLPWAHVGGLALLLRALELGSRVALPEPPLPDDLDGLVRRHRITHLSLVPLQLRRWLDRRGPGPAPPTLRCILLGGAPAPPALLEAAKAAGLPVRLTYGLTEASSQVATAEDQTPPGSVGPSLPDVEVQVRDEAGRSLGAGSEGDIWVRSPALMLGYQAEPDLTKHMLQDGWLRTADLGRLDAAGNLWVLGRRSSRINTGGEKVDPAEVEAVLGAHPGIAEACVVGVPDATWGEAVGAAVTARPGHTLTPAELASHCRGLLAPFKVPKRWRLVASLPRTAGGKVALDEVRAALEHPIVIE